MNMSNMEKAIRKILKDSVKSNRNFDEIDISESLTLMGLNSVDFIKIAVGIEEEFEIKLNDDDLDFDYFNTIEKIIIFIENKKL